jgi:hypothetical protein
LITLAMICSQIVVMIVLQMMVSLIMIRLNLSRPILHEYEIAEMIN